MDPFGFEAYPSNFAGWIGFYARESVAGAGLGIKGFLWTGPSEAVVGIAETVAHPIQTAVGVYEFGEYVVTEPRNAASDAVLYVRDVSRDPERIGAIGFDVAAGFATGGASRAGAIRYLKRVPEAPTGAGTTLRRLITEKDGMALNPFKRGSKEEKLPIQTEFEGPGFERPEVPFATRNAHLAGQKHPVTGIPFDDLGYPDFSSVARVEVRIEFSGNRSTDFIRANRAAGLDETPHGYTWHHHQDQRTMQLVPTEIHEKTGHDGGFGLGR